MVQSQEASLEQALARSEADANASIKAAQAVLAALRKFRNAASTGDLRGLHAAIEAADRAEALLRQQIATSRSGWYLDEEAYLSGGSFVSEVLDTARQKGVSIFQRDDRLYSYPVLVRVLPGERAVRIDKVKEKRLRPSVLVEHLRELQKKPPRFRPEVFLQALYEAYDMAVKARGKGNGTVVPLLEIYELFTLLPGQSKEYSRQEFARDVYLLDRSGVVQARNGASLSLVHRSTGVEGRRVVGVINEHGEEKAYYGISFSSAALASKE